MSTPKYFNVRSFGNILTPDQIKYFLDITTKVQGVEEFATADQTAEEIQTAYDSVVDIVSQADAEAGVSTDAYRWTPERVKQAIDALGGVGGGSSQRTIGVTFDGGGATPDVGSVGFVVSQFAGTIDRWDIVADASGSAVVDVWKAAGAIPTDSDRIAGTEKLTLTAAQLASDTNLTTWSTLAVAVGDVIGFELESVTTCTRVTAQVRIAETI